MSEQQENKILTEIVRNMEWSFVSPNAAKRCFTAVSTDSRSVKENDLFVALRGVSKDGHQFIGAALRQGAAAAVVDQAWFATAPEGFPLFVTDDTLRAFQEIARRYRRKLDPQVTAVTGSAGKTSAKEMIAAVLSRRYRVCRSVKSFNNHVGVPTTLLQLRPEHQMLVAELGTSNFGELSRLSELTEPDVCVLLNIGYAHLEFLKNREGIARAKMEIFDYASPDHTAIINSDDDLLIRQSYRAHRVVTFGIDSPAEVRGAVIGCNDDGCFTFACGGTEITLAVPGRHMVYNALAAVAVGRLFNVPEYEIKAALEEVTGAEHRLQIRRAGGLLVIDDAYNANPASCRAALQTLAEMKCRGRRIAVLGDMLELGDAAETEHRRLAETALTCGVDLLFLFGKLTRFTAESAAKAGMKNLFHTETQEDLIEALKDAVQPGDLVLVKGSRSMRMEVVVDELLKKV